MNQNGQVDNSLNKAKAENRNSELSYGIDDSPPWYLCLFMALQVNKYKYKNHKKKEEHGILLIQQFNLLYLIYLFLLL